MFRNYCPSQLLCSCVSSGMEGNSLILCISTNCIEVKVTVHLRDVFNWIMFFRAQILLLFYLDCNMQMCTYFVNVKGFECILEWHSFIFIGIFLSEVKLKLLTAATCICANIFLYHADTFPIASYHISTT